MLALLIDALFDTLAIMPILFIVYLALGFAPIYLNTNLLMHSTLGKFGPILAALAGSIPQCGFSTASAALYNNGVLGAGTLIAVFLATSDEAIPIMLAHQGQANLIASLIICKIIFAIFWGYLFRLTVFRDGKARHVIHLSMAADNCDKSCCYKKSTLLVTALNHTIKTAFLIFLVLMATDIAIFLIGQEKLQTLLLSQNLFQPLLSAFVGLIPGCGTSILITELFLNHTLSFGSAIAGLSTNAGLGFIMLFRNKRNFLNSCKIILWTYFAAAVSGIFLQLIAPLV